MGVVTNTGQTTDGPPQQNQTQPQDGGQEAANSCAQREDANFGGNNNSGGSPGQQGSDGYNADLFHTTAYAATLQSHEEHPDLPNLSAGAAHAGADTVLYDRGYAAEQNRLYLEANPTHMAPYHEDRPIIGYSTDMQTDSMSRVYGNDTQMVGSWATRDADLRSPSGGYVSGAEAESRLSMINTPTDVAGVVPDLGTSVFASRPISDAAGQYKLRGSVNPAWFAWKASLT